MAPDDTATLSDTGGYNRNMNNHNRHRFPPDIIAHAVWLCYPFNLSHRDIEDLPAERGITVSREAIQVDWSGAAIRHLSCRCPESIQSGTAPGPGSALSGPEGSCVRRVEQGGCVRLSARV